MYFKQAVEGVVTLVPTTPKRYLTNAPEHTHTQRHKSFDLSFGWRHEEEKKG